MTTLKTHLLLTFMAALPCVALAQATINVPSASPAGFLGDAGNSTLLGAFTETFVANSLTWSGTVSGPFFFEQDVAAAIDGPGNLDYTGPLGGSGVFLGATPFSGWFADFTPEAVTGSWGFEVFSPVGPGGAAWSLQDSAFSFNESLFPPAAPLAVNAATLDIPVTEGEIVWFDIDHAGGQFEATAAGSTLAELDGQITPDDTFIALYAADASLVASDDLSGPGLTSLISLADLPAGEYRLAVTGGTLGTIADDGFITTTHDAVGTIRLSVTSVPEPGSLLLLAATLTGLCFRKRV